MTQDNSEVFQNSSLLSCTPSWKSTNWVNSTILLQDWWCWSKWHAMKWLLRHVNTSMEVWLHLLWVLVLRISLKFVKNLKLLLMFARNSRSTTSNTKINLKVSGSWHSMLFSQGWMPIARDAMTSFTSLPLSCSSINLKELSWEEPKEKPWLKLSSKFQNNSRKLLKVSEPFPMILWTSTKRNLMRTSLSSEEK